VAEAGQPALEVRARYLDRRVQRRGILVEPATRYHALADELIWHID